MTKLDEIALNIELVLISIIQGVALIKLAENAIPFLHDASELQYLPFILAGLVILLVFWAQAILHAISFIRWPLKMEHMFLYFVAAFLQVVAYSNMTDLTVWFFWWSVFSILVVFVYLVDLRIIRTSVSHFAHMEGGTAYIQDIERRHTQELWVLVPIAIVFNVAALIFTYAEPSLFANPVAFAALGTLQCLISFGALVNCVQNFGSRSSEIARFFRS